MVSKMSDEKRPRTNQIQLSYTARAIFIQRDPDQRQCEAGDAAMAVGEANPKRLPEVCRDLPSTGSKHK